MPVVYVWPWEKHRHRKLLWLKFPQTSRPRKGNFGIVADVFDDTYGLAPEIPTNVEAEEGNFGIVADVFDDTHKFPQTSRPRKGNFGIVADVFDDTYDAPPMAEIPTNVADVFDNTYGGGGFSWKLMPSFPALSP